MKSLENKNFIKSIQSAKFPKRKVYILAHLQPSEDITGGPFYTDGVLDEEFVHQLGVWAERYVLVRSWYHPSVKGLEKKRRKLKPITDDSEARKAQEFREAARERSRNMLPMPPGYTGYPTVPEVTRAVNESGLSGVVMKEVEMQQLMETLCWDGRLMKVMDGQGFKSVRGANSSEADINENSLTESPCGNCPVFDLCEEGGPVNARSCTYFQEWLAF